jgi:cytochrome oxidase Cu insertion factor (SCO1/SenC/PrrC family)
MTDADPSRKRSRRLFLGLALLFFAPIAIAFALYFLFPQLAPAGKLNHGLLVDPARPLPELRFANAQGELHDLFLGKWSYVYVGAAQCDDACARTLYDIRQLRTLLNDKRERVQRVYVAPDAAALEQARTRLAADHPDLAMVAPLGDSGAVLRRFFGIGQPSTTLYLVDPHGNWLMSYPPGSDLRGVLEDIKRLLRLSQIG